MTKKLLTLFFAIIACNCFAQIKFENGYFITDSNQKIECLIKNIDWKSNPTQFEYQLTQGSEVKIETSKNVKEFAVYNSSKFIRENVNIDRSSVNIQDLSREKNPIFKQEMLFLRVLVEGDYNLYEYTDGNLRRYFYNNKDSKIEQLVYKQYITDLTKATKNNTYQQQLYNSLKCPSITLKKIESISYRKDDLVEFFKEYNRCHNSESSYVEEKPTRNVFDLSIRPRVNSSSLYVGHDVLTKWNTDFGNKINFGIGIEAEYFLPYNKNKWSLIAEPTYQTYISEKITGKNSDYVAKVDYASIEFPFGLRHYFFLNPKSKIFVNMTYSYILRLDSNITYTRTDNRSSEMLDVEPNKNLALGAGYKFNDKFSAEFRYNSRSLLDKYVLWNSSFKSASLIVGYTLF